jgi:AraC-like DNA-binding protein
VGSGSSYREYPAAPPLDAFVESFWFLRGALAVEEEQVVVPDGRIELVLHLGEPFSLIGEDGVARKQQTALVGGQLTSPIRLRSRGAVDVIGIRFRPATASALLPLSLGELTGQVTPLGAVHARLTTALLGAASTTTAIPRRVEAMTRVLERFVVAPPPRTVIAAARALDQPTPPSITSLSRELRVTARTLERHLLHHVGLTPKMFHRVLRFRRAFRLLERMPPGRWDRAALAAGYFDQAHMIRDFKEFAGAPPSTFFRTDPAFARALMGGDAEDEPTF